jgi:hypothetical protein
LKEEPQTCAPFLFLFSFYDYVSRVWHSLAKMSQEMAVYSTVRLRGIGTGISEVSKRVPIFLHDIRGGKQVSFCFGLQKLRQTQETEIKPRGLGKAQTQLPRL